MYLYSGKKRKTKKILIIGLVLVLIIFGSFKLIQIYNDIEVEEFNTVKAERLSGEISEGSNKSSNSNNVVDMLEHTTNSVVGISKLKNNGDTVFLEDGVTQMGIGSGVIISEQGYILTNEHVSGQKNSICYVTMEDGKNYDARVVWSDANLDLSIIKINMKCINYAKLGDSDSIRVGQNVYAIGNPIGFEFQKTVTSGIISAVDRTITFVENGEDVYMSNLIQTDATINPGNSGGPLINDNGEIIGINTVKITSAEGIGFAVPINVIKPILQKLETYGIFEEASIGIFAYDKNVIPYLNSKIKFDTGIYVAQVSLDSPAYQTGLQVGDVITKIDDIEIEKMCDLREYIYFKNVGDVVNLTVLRNNRERNIEVKLN